MSSNQYRVTKFDPLGKRYLSIFKDRCIPEFILQDYPEFVTMLDIFFDDLDREDYDLPIESRYGAYALLRRLTQLFDIDYTEAELLPLFVDSMLYGVSQDVKDNIDVRKLLRFSKDLFSRKGRYGAIEFILRLAGITAVVYDEKQKAFCTSTLGHLLSGAPIGTVHNIKILQDGITVMNFCYVVEADTLRPDFVRDLLSIVHPAGTKLYIKAFMNIENTPVVQSEITTESNTLPWYRTDPDVKGAWLFNALGNDEDCTGQNLTVTTVDNVTPDLSNLIEGNSSSIFDSGYFRINNGNQVDGFPLKNVDWTPDHFNISCWVRCTTIQAALDIRGIFSIYLANTAGSFALAMDVANIGIYVSDGATPSINCTAGIEENKWYHVSLTWDNVLGKYYFDVFNPETCMYVTPNSLNNFTPGAGNIPVGNTIGFKIGTLINNSDGFFGNIDELIVTTGKPYAEMVPLVKQLYSNAGFTFINT